VTFEEWIQDDRNLRELERRGFFVSVPPAEDGKPRWRRTDKQCLGPVILPEIENLN
jgi:hypothetical protein